MRGQPGPARGAAPAGAHTKIESAVRYLTTDRSGSVLRDEFVRHRKLGSTSISTAPEFDKSLEVVLGTALVVQRFCRKWLDEIVAGNVTSVEQIANREGYSVRQVNMIISLAFLSPALVRAAVDGRLPRGVGVASLRDSPAAWSLQHKMLGLAL